MIAIPTDKKPVTVIHGDSYELFSQLPSSIDAVITDPPWGVAANTDYTRFGGHRGTIGTDWGKKGIQGDDEDFDPRPWLKFPRVAFWGANCFTQHLPVGRWLVWVKKATNQLGTFMSDAELCWTNKPPQRNRAPGVYVKTHIWNGFDRQSERAHTILHPMQKPIAIWEWVLEMAEVPVDALVLDPFAGSGGLALACLATGRRCIAIEKDERYAKTCKDRVAEAIAYGKNAFRQSDPQTKSPTSGKLW